MGHENPCPLLPVSPGWAPGTLSSHGKGLAVLAISAWSPCISNTPFLSLLFLTGWVGWKEGEPF